jgi:hypothetical protein
MHEILFGPLDREWSDSGEMQGEADRKWALEKRKAMAWMTLALIGCAMLGLRAFLMELASATYDAYGWMFWWWGGAIGLQIAAPAVIVALVLWATVALTRR